jgi:hypothetical protein
MDEGLKDIHQKIALFKRRYYLNLFIRGAILFPAIVLAYYLLATVLEFNLWLGSIFRLAIFIVFFIVVGYSFFHFFWKATAWWIYKKGIREDESAKIIGHHFPGISDKLLNLIQLSSDPTSGPLINASIAQKSTELKDVQFEKAVDLKANRKYFRYLLLPVGAVLVLLFVDSTIFTRSTKRIVLFNQEFSPEAPFQFNVVNENLSAFFNEDFTLRVFLEGSAIPESAYLINGNQRWKMESIGGGKFEYTFEKIQNAMSFQIEASGFFSQGYKININNRPSLNQAKIQLKYPGYIGRRADEVTNAGAIEIPEGTMVFWKIGAANTARASILFSSNESISQMQLIDKQVFSFEKGFKNSDQYSILLENESSKNKDKISYSINVIKDQNPEIFVENMKDSVLYKSILLGGQVKDDYGISSLHLNYKIDESSGEGKNKSIRIPIAPGRAQQNFFFPWNLDSLNLKPGSQLSYYFEVWDNDGVNGRKSTRSANYIFALPSSDELKNEIANQQNSTEDKIDKSLKKAKDLKESINDAKQKLKGKQSLDWQDKKLLEDLVTKKQKLDETIEELKKENKLLEQQKESFTDENERIKEKSEQIQKLMNELLDEDTRKLFNDLEKLLKENADLQQLQKMLDRMDRKEINLEKELERTLSLFKQLQFDYKLDQAINELKSLSDEQEKLEKKTEKSIDEKNNSPESSTDKSLAKEQEALKNETQKLQNSVKELDKLGEEIDQKEELPTKEEFEQLDDSEQKSQESLEQGNPKKSVEQQKKSLKKMQEMQKQLEGAQSSMEMEIDTQNLESLRQIVHGLIKLSYDQENLMKEFNGIQPSDPRNIQISQNQLKLQDDVKILEDSLLSLSKKDAMMGSVVTREIGELNDHIEKVVYNMKERRKGNASSEMQFSMTNINNLALLLNDHFEMMMNMMANAMPSAKGKGKKQDKGPSLGKMQQEINKRIEELKSGQKMGRQYSEELARMAAEQARIRKALQEMQQKMKKEGGKEIGNDIGGKMEQTESDLVNKRITEQTIQRQKEILTRLLEAEKSMREQDMDEERKGESARNYEKEIPRAFEEYLKLKEKEVELLKTVPPRLFPYYKKEVTEYFKRIN